MEEIENIVADPLESSRRKLDRAEQHFQDLQRLISTFLQEKPWEKVVEAHPARPGFVVHKVKLTKELPPAIADTTADIVQNLRNALDNAGYSVAIAAGVNNPKYSAFPFAGSIDQLPNALGRSKDIHPQIQSLFCGFQPYPEGDTLLWALNQIAIADKHKMLIPIGAAIVSNGVNVRGTGFFSMPEPLVWDRTKNEMELLTLGPGAEFRYDLHFNTSVAFNLEPVDGESVVTVIYALGQRVQSILMAIGAEARRIGIFK